jgi:hypothetical protein
MDFPFAVFVWEMPDGRATFLPFQSMVDETFSAQDSRFALMWT